MTRHRTTAGSGLDRRRHCRAEVTRPLRLQIAGRDEVLAVTANLSPGGLFVKTTAPAAVGTRVRFALDLGARAVRGHAEVAWIRLRSGGPRAPRGMGLRIVFLLDDGARHLAALVAGDEDGA